MCNAAPDAEGASNCGTDESMALFGLDLCRFRGLPSSRDDILCNALPTLIIGCSLGFVFRTFHHHIAPDSVALKKHEYVALAPDRVGFKRRIRGIRRRCEALPRGTWWGMLANGVRSIPFESRGTLVCVGKRETDYYIT